MYLYLCNFDFNISFFVSATRTVLHIVQKNLPAVVKAVMAAKAGRVATVGRAAKAGKAAKRPIGGLYVGTRLLHYVGLLHLKNHDVILAIRIPQIKKPRFLKKIKGNRERIPVMKILLIRYCILKGGFFSESVMCLSNIQDKYSNSL